MLFLRTLLVWVVLVVDYAHSDEDFQIPLSSSMKKGPSNKKPAVNDDFIPLQRQVVYQEIKTFDNTSFLLVKNYPVNTQSLFKIVMYDSVPVIHDNLEKSVYVVTSGLNAKPPTLSKAYLDSAEKLIVENPLSRTKFSKVTADKKGNIVLNDYDIAKGIKNYTRGVPQGLVIDTYGNQFIGTSDSKKPLAEMFIFPVYTSCISSLPIAFDELTGDGFLVYTKNNETNSNIFLYNLEYNPEGIFRAIDRKTGRVYYVAVDSQGTVQFNQKPMKRIPAKSFVTIKNAEPTSNEAVRRTFEQRLEVDDQGRSVLASVDQILCSTTRIPVQTLDGLPVVYDYFTSNAYLVSRQGLLKLYQYKDNKYVVSDSKSRTGYSFVSVDKKGNTTFTPYFQTPADLNPVSKEFGAAVVYDKAGNQMFSASVSSFNDSSHQYFPVSKNFDNIPVVYDNLSGQAILIALADTRIYYLLEQSASGKYFATDRFTKKKFELIIKEDSLFPVVIGKQL